MNVPYTAIHFATYESAKGFLSRSGSRADEGLAVQLGAGGLAGGLAAAATTPLDVVKTRLQVLGAAEPGRRRSALAVAAELRAAEGLKGFARGLGPRVATLSLGSSVSWCVYELAKRQLAARERGGDAADDF